MKSNEPHYIQGYTTSKETCKMSEQFDSFMSGCAIRPTLWTSAVVKRGHDKTANSIASHEEEQHCQGASSLCTGEGGHQGCNQINKT